MTRTRLNLGPRRAIATSLFPSAPKSIDLPLKSLFPFLGLFRICLWVAQPEKSGKRVGGKTSPFEPPTHCLRGCERPPSLEVASSSRHPCYWP